MKEINIEYANCFWKPIPNYPEYYASRTGQILSTKRKSPIIMKQITTTDGHKYVFMYIDGKMKKVWVHRAVLLAWKGFPEEGQQGRHLNDNPGENDITNLAWGTSLENANDKRLNGRIPMGEKSVSHKLTESQVIEIRGLHGKKTLRELARIYGVFHTCIRRAALGIKWACIKEGLA